MSEPIVFQAPLKALWLARGLAVVGGVTLAAGLLVAPQRTWANFLLLNYGLLGLGLGGLVWISFHYLTGARWSVPLRRVPEAMAAIVPWAGAGMLAVLLLRPSLYAWTASSAVEGSASHLKQIWLTRPFFLLRALVYLAVWIAFAMAIVRTSRRQDQVRDSSPTRKNVALSAGFLVVFGVTCWLASYDWIMSLEPAWASSIFGVYNFAGMFLGSLAAAVMLAIWLRREKAFAALAGGDRLHDLGTLLFAFSSFWMYAWFCQYMLIWYVNIPEESAYFVRRWQGEWRGLVALNLVLNWGIGFVVLLFRRAKCSAGILGAVALAVLAGRWLDLYLMVCPSQAGVGPQPGAIEAGLLLGAAGVFGWVVLRALERAPLVPVRDPFEAMEGRLESSGECSANASIRAKPHA